MWECILSKTSSSFLWNLNLFLNFELGYYRQKYGRIQRKTCSTFLAQKIFKGNLLTNKNNYKNEKELKLATFVEFH